MPRARLVGALTEKGVAKVVRENVPKITKGHVLVRVRASLISSGTEGALVQRLRSGEAVPLTFPFPFGYQNAGEVLETGRDVNEFKPGDRVACMGGGYALHTDYALVPCNLCAHLPDGVSFEEGAFAHLAITSLQAIRRGRPEAGEYLLVVGLGVVGQLVAQLGRISGAYVMGWDAIKKRCDAAEHAGAHATMSVGSGDAMRLAKEFTRGHGFDMAVMAFGGDGSKALQDVKNVMKISPDGHPMGRIVMVGGLTTTCQWGAAMGNLDLLACSRTGPGYHDARWERGETEYPGVFVRWTTKSNMEFVLRLMAEGRLPVKHLITHRFPLGEIGKAVDTLLADPAGTLGVVLQMSHSERRPA